MQEKVFVAYSCGKKLWTDSPVPTLENLRTVNG